MLLGQVVAITHRQAHRLWIGPRCCCKSVNFSESLNRQCSFAGLLLLSLLLPKGFKLHHAGASI